ncbi:MAG: type II toxin-antitoxin system RelE/ParE family toxin [Gammaproteobacteria bacterium]|nr:type II toxin-antitoxin system RelE/ParE family toxin [Gammaproteobacteria bacterium]
MNYTISIKRSAQKSLGKITSNDRALIIDKIRLLSENPRPAGSKKLTGREAWRIRIGNYRVIYEIHEGELLILVVAIGHRREIYR